MMGLATLAISGWPARATDAEAVLSTLPLPRDIDPPTEVSIKQDVPLQKLVLGRPIADGDLRSGFGIRRHPILRSSKMHTGVDWAARFGAPILSAGNGAVIKAEWVAGYGLRVEIQHPDGVVTAYSHMSRLGTDIASGTEVRQGQVIGFVGSTGLSTGPHLHYEVIVNGHFVDPMDIYAPGGASMLAQVRKTTSAALDPPLKQPSSKPVLSAQHTPVRRTAAAPSRPLKPRKRWAEHESRMRSIQSKITASTLMIMR